MERFRGGLVFEAHRLLHHSTLGSRVMNKKKMLVVICARKPGRRAWNRAFYSRVRTFLQVVCFGTRK